MSKAHKHLELMIVPLLLVITASGVLANEHPTLQSGSRVRITLIEPKVSTLADPKRVKGLLSSLTAEEITLETSAGKPPKVFLRNNVEQLELNTQRGRRRRGSLIGLGVGAASGFLFGLVVVGDTHDNPHEWFPTTAPESGAIWSVPFALVGALIGALVAPGERWQPIPSDQIQLGVDTHQRGQSRLFITMRF